MVEFHHESSLSRSSGGQAPVPVLFIFYRLATHCISLHYIFLQIAYVLTFHWSSHFFVLPLTVLTPAPFPLYSPSTARPHPFLGLPLHFLSLPVLNPSAVSIYSSFHCPYLSPLILLRLPVYTPSPVSHNSSLHCPSVPLDWSLCTLLSTVCAYPITGSPSTPPSILLHRSQYTPPSNARPYPFTGLSLLLLPLPLLLIPLPVHTPSPVSLYSTVICPSLPLYRSLSIPHSNARPYPFTSIPLLLFPLPVHTPSPASLYSSFHCPSIPLHRPPSTPLSTTRPIPFTGFLILLFARSILTPSPVSVYSSFQGPSLTLHRSPSTPHSAASPYHFTGLPLLHLPLPVLTHTPLPVSHYSPF